MAKVARFGDFELDLGNYELSCAGQSLNLPRQQVKLLGLMLERAGKLVTRRAIMEELWGANPPAHVDHGIDQLISKLRQNGGRGRRSVPSRRGFSCGHVWFGKPEILSAVRNRRRLKQRLFHPAPEAPARLASVVPVRKDLVTSRTRVDPIIGDEVSFA